MTERLRAAQDARLADRVSIGVLVSLFPITLLDEVVQVSGCADRRRRALPARLMIYYALALCLFADRNYDQVMRLLLNGLSWRSRWIRSWEDPPSVSAISRARARLGAEPLRVLFDRVNGPIAEPGAPGAWYAGLRLVTLDGAALDVPESRQNAAFGYPGDHAHLPQVRLLAIAEEGTHALVDATFGPAAVSDRVLTGRLLRGLRPGMLLMAGAGSWTPGLWRRAAGTGAHLLCGGCGPVVCELPAGELLGDGSHLVKAAGITLRVVPLSGDDVLVTTLIDPVAAPAHELVAVYTGRWSLDGALAWLRTGSRPVVRSRNPEMVAQEIWALFCTYQAMRMLTCQAGPPAWPAKTPSIATKGRPSG